MNKTVEVLITWLPENEGGRKKLIPVDVRYYPLIYSKAIPFDGTTWSVSIYHKKISGLISEADMSFLSPDAPHEVLTTGMVFDLYEGPKCVASGEII